MGVGVSCGIRIAVHYGYLLKKGTPTISDLCVCAASVCEALATYRHAVQAFQHAYVCLRIDVGQPWTVARGRCFPVFVVDVWNSRQGGRVSRHVVRVFEHCPVMYLSCCE